MRPNPSGAARFVQAPPLEHPARWAIVASWNRCTGLSPHDAPPFYRVSDGDLAARLARDARLVEEAVPRLEWLLRQAPGRSGVAYVTDAEGIVLASSGDEAQRRRFCLLPGYDWSEARMGTNGVGTCLVTGRPMVVTGSEHFMTAFHDCTCTAVPIRGADARLMGALDVSSRVGEARGYRMARVTEAALEIERALLRA